MSATQPIRQICQLTEFKNYYLKERPNPRNYAMIVFGLNTALRISDILKTTWDMVYDFDNEMYRPHLYVREQKTGKETMIALNQSVISALDSLKSTNTASEQYLFPSQKNRDMPISRYQAFRIIKKAPYEKPLAIMPGKMVLLLRFLWISLIIPLIRSPNAICVLSRMIRIMFFFK